MKKLLQFLVLINGAYYLEIAYFAIFVAYMTKPTFVGKRVLHFEGMVRNNEGEGSSSVSTIKDFITRKLN